MLQIYGILYFNTITSVLHSLLVISIIFCIFPLNFFLLFFFLTLNDVYVTLFRFPQCLLSFWTGRWKKKNFEKFFWIKSIIRFFLYIELKQILVTILFSKYKIFRYKKLKLTIKKKIERKIFLMFKKKCKKTI